MLTLKTVFIAAALMLAACPGETPRAGDVTSEAGRRKQAELDDPGARRLAAEIANQAFAHASLLDAEGKPVSPPKLSPTDLRARRSAARWQLSYGGPAGCWAEVSFDAWGQEPSVKVGFAAE